MTAIRKYTEEQRENARIRAAQWVKDNPERHRANQRKYPERNRARVAAWVKANPEKHAANVNKWHAENPEKAKAARRKWVKSNPENVKAMLARWRRAHPEDTRTRAVAWARANPEKIKSWNAKARLRRGEAEGSFTAADIRAQFTRQSGLCYYCESPLQKYHADHKIPLVRGGSNWPDNIVCACSTCNLRKNKLTDTEFLARLNGDIADARQSR